MQNVLQYIRLSNPHCLRSYHIWCIPVLVLALTTVFFVITVLVWQGCLYNKCACVTGLLVWQQCFCDKGACVIIVLVCQWCLCGISDNSACVAGMLVWQQCLYDKGAFVTAMPLWQQFFCDKGDCVTNFLFKVRQNNICMKYLHRLC